MNSSQNSIKKNFVRHTDMRNKKCPWYNDCFNGNDGCYCADPENCVRFLPLQGTNLTKITGVIETHPERDCNKFSQYFFNWVESMGWHFCGSLCKYEEEDI